MADKLHRRTLLIIEPGLQFRYLVLPLIVTTTTAICLFALFALQAQSLKSFASQDPVLVEEIGTAQVLSGVACGAVLLGHIGLVVWLGLIASHRVAGPLYHIKQSMGQVAAGDKSVRVKLREKDHLTDVAQAFNNMMDALTFEEKELGEGKPELPGQAEELQVPDGPVKRPEPSEPTG